ncbi:hypothetical protein MKW94_013796 [Papaver nudicaule]|uniref:Thioredoxin domain-containing protein n=1 Tax=Papaver nudicaule TaxID=74823 RepID=A0AA41RNC2_PAPNU|nr:hypothetical protein [Papaver nudicaule]
MSISGADFTSSNEIVKIISTECIPYYPYRNVPTILVYYNNVVKGTYGGSHHFGWRDAVLDQVRRRFMVDQQQSWEVRI